MNKNVPIINSHKPFTVARHAENTDTSRTGVSQQMLDITSLIRSCLWVVIWSCLWYNVAARWIQMSESLVQTSVITYMCNISFLWQIQQSLS